MWDFKYVCVAAHAVYSIGGLCFIVSSFFEQARICVRFLCIRYCEQTSTYTLRTITWAFKFGRILIFMTRGERGTGLGHLCVHRGSQHQPRCHWQPVLPT